MEKIKFKPLIDHLQQAGDQYNNLYRENELRYHAIPQPLLTSWMVSVIEPIVMATSGDDNIHTGKIFQALFKNLLPLLGNHLGINYEREYQSAWLMLQKNPHLMQTAPSGMLTALNSALLTIRRDQPSKVLLWIDHMDKTIAHCATTDEFMMCGRIYAWLCGMAYLKSRAVPDLHKISDELKTTIAAVSGISLRGSLNQNWSVATPAFIGTTGGFIGFGGPFATTPRVAAIENTIVAADHKSTTAVFADEFGTSLLIDLPFRSADVKQEASLKAFLSFQNKFGKKLIPFTDVNSAVMKDGTLVLTRESSFYLFIYGWQF